MSRFVLWGIVGHGDYPVRIVGGTNSQCRREAAIREQLASYRCLRIVPEGEPYGETPVRHRTTGKVGTAVAVLPGNRRFPEWHPRRRDWIRVRFDNITCNCPPSKIEYLEEAHAA